MEEEIEVIRQTPYAIDIHVMKIIEPQRLVGAFTDAFELRAGNVEIAPSGSNHGMQLWNLPATRITVQQSYDLGGEFPTQYQVTFKGGRPDRLVDRLGRVAASIGEAFVTSLGPETNSQAEYRLALPDGTISRIMLDSDAIDEDQLVLQEIDSERMKQAYVNRQLLALAK